MKTIYSLAFSGFLIAQMKDGPLLQEDGMIHFSSGDLWINAKTSFELVSKFYENALIKDALINIVTIDDSGEENEEMHKFLESDRERLEKERDKSGYFASFIDPLIPEQFNREDSPEAPIVTYWIKIDHPAIVRFIEERISLWLQREPWLPVRNRLRIDRQVEKVVDRILELLRDYRRWIWQKVRRTERRRTEDVTRNGEAFERGWELSHNVFLRIGAVETCSRTFHPFARRTKTPPTQIRVCELWSRRQ